MKKIAKIFLLVIFAPVVSFANGSQAEGIASGDSSNVSQEMANVAKYISGAKTEAPKETSKAQTVDFDQRVTTGDKVVVSKEMSDVSKYISDAGVKEEKKEAVDIDHETYVQSMYVEQSATLSSLYEQKSYVPRLYLGGYVGSSLVGDADLLIPVYLTGDRTFVVYGQGRYGLDFDAESWENNTWTGSGGLLYRQIINDQILGVYVLGDYSQTSSDHNYWVLGPGLESLGKVWDFHLNGYIPIGDKYWKNEDWAQNYGMYEYTSFIEGSNYVFDHRIAYYEDTGVGADVEVGRNLAKIGNGLLKGYVQGYYYNMDYNDNLFGMGVKVTYQPSSYITFSANDTYDNDQHNVFMLGVQVRINDLFSKEGRSKKIDEKDLSARLLDPIDRNYSSIGKGTATPSLMSEPQDLGQFLYTSNGVFFSDNGSGYVSPNADQYKKGTYGNPYTEEDDITTYGMQTIFNEVYAEFSPTGNPIYMYFAPGSYTANNGSSAIELYDDMSIYGRDYWYTTPTTGAQRATLIGSLSLAGNNTLDSIMVQNYVPIAGAENNLDGVGDGEFDIGISTLSGATNINLNNVEVGAENNTQGYATGILMDNSVVTISNSNIYGYQYGAATADGQINATGIEMINGGTLTVSHSNVYGKATETSGSYDNSGNGYGIHADGKQETITVENGSYIFGSGQGDSSGSGNGYGISVSGESYITDAVGDYSIHDNTLNIYDSVLEGEGNNINNTGSSSGSGNGYGLLVGYNYAYMSATSTDSANFSIYQNPITISGSTLIGEGTTKSGTSSGNGYGLLVGNNSLEYDNDNADNSAKIYNNDIDILDGSELSGIGTGTGTGGGGGAYVGNGYGLLMGYNSFYSSTDNVLVDASIYNNNLNIADSVLAGNGNSSSGTSASGNGYGLLVGYNSAKTSNNSSGDYYNFNIYNNAVVTTNSALSGSGYNVAGSVSGNGYGLLIGYNKLLAAAASLTYTSVYINTVSVVDSAIEANSNGLVGYAWGINFGENGDAGSKQNALTVTNSSIMVNASGRDAYGIWMLKDSGTASIDTNTQNNVTRSDGNAGEKIDVPGLLVNW